MTKKRLMACSAVIVVLCCLAPGAWSEEPPKELKEILGKATELLEKKKYQEYYQLTMHPKVRLAFEQGGMTLEKLALIMEKKPEVATLYKRAFTAMKEAGCQLNAEKTEATFRLPAELAESQLGKVLTFEKYEGRWWMAYK